MCMTMMSRDIISNCPECNHGNPGLDIGYVPAGPDAFFRWSGLPFIFEKFHEGGS